MKVKKADDYQSWFIEEGNEALLIDPWFDLSLVDGKGWFLQRKKEKKSHLTEDEIFQVKNIIITAPFEDHLHLNTLKEFSKANIWCSTFIIKFNWQFRSESLSRRISLQHNSSLFKHFE